MDVSEATISVECAPRPSVSDKNRLRTSGPKGGVIMRDTYDSYVSYDTKQALVHLGCSPYYVQDGSAQKIAPIVCGHCQPCTSAQTNPTLDLTSTQTLTLTPALWGD